MCKGTQLPEWKKLSVKPNQQVVIIEQGRANKPHIVRTAQSYDTLIKQRLAKREIKSWEVQDIPMS